MPEITNVPVQNVRAEFQQAADHIKSATTNNTVISEAELSAALDRLTDRRERALVSMLYSYAGHLDGDRLTSQRDVDAALHKNLDRLVDGRDTDRDGNLSNTEARALSQMGRIAHALAKSRLAAAPTTPPSTPLGEVLDRAIAAGYLTLEKRGDAIVGVKVDETMDAGTLPGEPELLAMVLDLPQAKGIERINVGHIAEWDGQDTYQAAIAEIAKRGPFPALKDLFVGDFTQSQSEISWADLGDVAPLYAAAPNLESLKLRGGGIDLGTLAHDELKTLTIETGGLPAKSMAAVGDAKLPNLESLAVWFGDSEYGFTGEHTTLMNLLEGDDRPKLKHLGLQNAEFTDALLPALVRANVVKQLDTLDLSMGTMTDRGAQVLIDHAPALAHLSSINLDENFLGADTIARLVDTFGAKVSAGGQKENYDDRFYVSVGE